MKDQFDGYEVKTYGKITTRDYQQAAIDAAINHVKTSTDPAILNMSVGAGKTIVIAALCKHVSDKNGKVMVLSRQGIIIEQDAQDTWLAECRNSIFSASLGIKSSAYPVILGSEGTVWNAFQQDLHSLGLIDSEKQKAPSKLFDYYADLVLIDEAHHFDFTNEECQYYKIIKELQRRNPKVRILGLTGTPFRGVAPIIGGSEDYFWKKQIIDVSCEYLTDRKFLVPCTFGFGHDDVQYDLSEFKSDGEDGIRDYTSEQLRQMEKTILKAETTTEKIIMEVVERTKNRNCVLITCSGKKHMKEAARFLPENSYVMITEDMSDKVRTKELKKAYDGEIKYILQINTLATGYNNPRLDVIVILRKIGSLTLLVQLIGRGLRLLKQEQIDAGVKKSDCLVLDYTDTMMEMRDLYDSRVLEDADYSKAHDANDLIECPKCGEMNSKYAVRCRGHVGGERCDFFWKSRICEPFRINGRIVNHGCGAENAPTARSCRCCDNTLIDPNEKLLRKAYSANEYKPVERLVMKPTPNNGVIVEYHLPDGEVATNFYSPFSDNKTAQRIFYNKFTKHHANTAALKAIVRKARNAGELCGLVNMLDTIGAITHRKNEKGESVVGKLITKSEM